MTARQVYEYVLIELGKINAPALKLYEFNYLFNKAINQYINTIYTKVYDQNQQSTDDLRVLKSTAYLRPNKFNPTNSAILGQSSSVNASSYLSYAHSSIQSLHGATYEVQMPLDYLHILNCICVYRVNKTKDCYDAGSYIQIPATRLTADSWALIVSDMYNRPTPMRPYYYLHNQANTVSPNILPQNPVTAITPTGMTDGIDMSGIYKVQGNGYTKITVNSNIYYNYNGNIYQLNSGTFNPSNPGTALTSTNLTTALNNIADPTAVIEVFYENPENTVAKASGTANQISEGSNFPRTLKLDLDHDGTPETNVSLVEKPIALRAGNPSNVRMEIRYGKDDTVFQLVEVQVDYVKTPQHIRLTQEQIDLTEDTSQIMEFPDYVCQEIINGLVTILMLRNNDPKLQSKYGIDQQLQQAVLLNQPAMAAPQQQA